MQKNREKERVKLNETKLNYIKLNKIKGITQDERG